MNLFVGQAYMNSGLNNHCKICKYQTGFQSKKKTQQWVTETDVLQ